MQPTTFSGLLKSRKNFASLEQEAFLSILHTADLLMFDLNRLLKPEGLTNAGYNVLRILRGAGDDGVTCREIADRMLNRDPDVTRLVDRLVKRGLAGRLRHDKDRRVVMVSITEKGLRLLDELDQPVIALHRRQLAHIGKGRLERLTAILRALREG